MNQFNRLKEEKKQNKQFISIWYSEFERKNKRKPND